MVESHCSEQEVWTTTLKAAAVKDSASQTGVVYYFEATKSYGEFAGTRTTGWVMLSPNGDNTFGVATNPLSGEAGAVTLDVLGVVRSGSSEFWVLQRNGYESESYIVYQWPEGRELVNLFGGGC